MGASDFSKLPHIGEAVLRKEDERFLTGAGQYTDDIALGAQAYAVFVRSPHAHAGLRGVNTAAAKAAPGVIGVLTGTDVAADKINGLPCGWLITSINGEPMKEPPHPILALDTVAIRWPWWWPRRCSRRATRPSWWRSTTRCGPRW